MIPLGLGAALSHHRSHGGTQIVGSMTGLWPRHPSGSKFTIAAVLLGRHRNHRHQAQIAIERAAPELPDIPRLRAWALLRRRPEPASPSPADVRETCTISDEVLGLNTYVAGMPKIQRSLCAAQQISSKRQRGVNGSLAIETASVLVGATGHLQTIGPAAMSRCDRT